MQAPEPLKRSLRSLRRSQRKLARRKAGSREPGQGQGGRGPAAPQDGKYPQGLPASAVAPDNGRRPSGPSGNPLAERLAKDVGTKDVSPGPGGTAAAAGIQGPMAGRDLREGGPGLPSSQLCHDCGERKGKLGPEVRRWRCSACGTLQDRDDNAALNIRDWPGATRSLPVDASGKTFSVKAPAVEAGTESLARQINHG